MGADRPSPVGRHRKDRYMLLAGVVAEASGRRELLGPAPGLP